MREPKQALIAKCAGSQTCDAEVVAGIYRDALAHAPGTEDRADSSQWAILATCADHKDELMDGDYWEAALCGELSEVAEWGPTKVRSIGARCAECGDPLKLGDDGQLCNDCGRPWPDRFPSRRNNRGVE